MAHVAGYLHAAAAAAGSGPGCGPLFFCEGRSTSALDASQRVSALAAGLAQRLGVQVGDRVCLAALATDHTLEALLAITAAGAVAAPLNWRWSPQEAAHAAELVDTRLLLADAACLRFALQLAAACRGAIAALVLLGPPAAYQEADLAAAPVPLVFAETLIGECPNASQTLCSAPGNTALIVYTSGTTGKPKGVALSHAALHAQSMAKLLTCGYSSSDVYLHAAPLFHIGGLSSALAMLAAGARHVFLPRFDGAALVAAVQQHGVTSFIAVPAMVADLLTAASQAGVTALPSVRRILVGGGGMSPQLQEGLAVLCPAATVHSAYGMTEGASSLTFDTLWGPTDASSTTGLSTGGSGRPTGMPAAARPAVAAAAGAQAGPPGGVFVGRPPPGIELAVYQPPAGNFGPAGGSSSSPDGAISGGSSGRIQLAGEGEVLTRGPHVMLGYWGDDDATAAAQLPGGWLRTGDLGYLSQGQLWLMGRAKDMIKSGGENVHAWEVERALASHPAVALAAVVGASDWRLGEAVAAAVVLRPGWRWQGERCQVLLQPQGQAGRAAAAKVALAAAAAAVAPASIGNAGGGSGGVLAGGSEEGGVDEEERAAATADGSLYAEDFRSTLLQRSPSRPGSAQRMLSADAGLLAALAVPANMDGQHRRQLPGVLQQLQSVAAGLQRAAAASSSTSAQHGSGGVGGHAGDAGDTQVGVVDGRLLQQHCRATGLAGFKLPRVFLLCDAAGSSGSMSGGTSRSSSSSVALPVNSTGKVVKHLLRQQVQQHMQAASKAAVGARSRL